MPGKFARHAGPVRVDPRWESAVQTGIDAGRAVGSSETRSEAFRRVLEWFEDRPEPWTMDRLDVLALAEYVARRDCGDA